MNSLQLETGGRPVANDDFQVLQDRDAVLGLPALLAGLGPCVVSGCRVWQTGSQYNVGPGMVWDGVNLLPFTGRSNVALPAMFAPGAVTVIDERAYQTGGTKTTIRGQNMELVPVDPVARNPLLIDSAGVLTFWHRTQAKIRTEGEQQTLGTRAWQPGDYDATGLGKRGTEAWGWALANGANDTDDMQTRSVAGYSPGGSEYAVGAAHGEYRVTLELANLPPNPPGTKDVATYVGGSAGYNLIPQVNGGWGGQQPRDGAGASIDTRSPYRALPIREWVGY